MVKYKGNAYYYGSLGAEWIFECIEADGSVNRKRLAEKPKPEEDPRPAAVTAIDDAVYADGYDTNVSAHNKGTDSELWLLTCFKNAPYEMLIIGYCASAEQSKTMGEMYAEAAKANLTKVKYRGNAFYYGTPGAEKFFDSVKF